MCKLEEIGPYFHSADLKWFEMLILWEDNIFIPCVLFIITDVVGIFHPEKFSYFLKKE